MDKGKIRIYGCGGAGINIASAFQGANEEGVATPVVSYIDTSRSNLTVNTPDEACYILKDLDGSGKIRAENHVQISNEIKSILLGHKPLDFNVVVFSCSGGSGSVIGPLLVAELLARDEAVVCVVVGSDESSITANNTLKTLKSLEAIARRSEKPVVMNYNHNSRGTPRSAQDAAMQYVVACLSLLCYKNIAEMDTKDVSNFLRFDRTTSVPAQLALLEIVKHADDIDPRSTPISIASIMQSADEPGINIVPEYHCAGYAKLPMSGVSSLHYVISVEPVNKIAGMLSDTLRGLDEVRQSRVATTSIVGKDDVAHGTGLIL